MSREKGNSAFKEGNYELAIELYTAAMAELNRREDKESPHFREQAALWGNRSACYLKLGLPQLAAADGFTCLDVNPLYAKAYLRVGQALKEMGNPGEAAALVGRGSEIAAKKEEKKTLLQHHRAWTELANRFSSMTTDQLQAQISVGAGTGQEEDASEEGEGEANLARCALMSKELGRPCALYNPCAHPLRDTMVKANGRYFEALTAGLGVRVQDITEPSGGAGRGVFAIQSFRQGETVFLDTPVFTVTLDDAGCDWCGATCASDALTSKCKNETYCSELCREEAWAAYLCRQSVEVSRGYRALKRQLRRAVGDLNEAAAEVYQPLAALRVAALAFCETGQWEQTDTTRNHCTIAGLGRCCWRDSGVPVL